MGPEPPRTKLSLLEGPSSLVKSPLSRYIGLIKGKYFNNMENGRFYSVVGGKKKACSKTACDLILFCKTKPTKHHKNTNTYSKEKGLKYMHQILLLTYWMISDFNFLHFTYLFYSDFNNRHGFFLIRKKMTNFIKKKKANEKTVSRAQWEESPWVGTPADTIPIYPLEAPA